MNACSRNAVFISFGDDDFYPFLYLQQHDAFRRDLYVVNYSLLALSPYIYAYAQPLFDAKRIDFGADTSLYKEGSNDYFELHDSSATTTIDQLLNKMREQKNGQSLELDGNVFAVKYRKDEVQTGGAIVGLLANVKIDGKYLLKNQWMLLDIINHLNGRELDLPNDFNDELKNLNDLLDWDGTVFRYENF